MSTRKEWDDLKEWLRKSGISVSVVNQISDKMTELERRSLPETGGETMSEPTIEKTIEAVQHHKISGYELSDKKCDLIIRALEEMRERENFKKEQCEYDWSYILPKPRTWDKVTLGEAAEVAPGQIIHLKRPHGISYFTFKGFAKEFGLVKQGCPFSHEPRLGSQFPEEKP